MKRYAVVGMSHRALKLCLEPVVKTYKDVAQIVAFLDLSPERMAAMNEKLGLSVPTFTPQQFDQMVEQTKPDVVVVTSMDSTHESYVVKALEHGLDVYCEKPLATTAESCRRILAAEKKSKGRVTVTFNYRYSPVASKVRELVQAGAVGKVVSVEMNYFVDTYHGSSYFMRWNRVRANSGGLSIHKASHHFDLVQWWIGQKPVEVFAYGTRNFYGPEGPRNPAKKDGRCCPTCKQRGRCDYYMRWHRDEWRGGQTNAALDEHVGGVQTFSHYAAASSRRCIFDSEIDIEDTYSAVVKYDGGASMSYSLIFSAPFEGYRAGINGLDGRIDIDGLDRGGRSVLPPPSGGITHTPLFGGVNVVAPIPASGGHGGADPLLQDDLFRGPNRQDKLGRMAPSMDGVLSVLVGVAVHRSIALRRPVKIKDLLEGRE